jgi:hypothetical protein
MRMNTYVNLRGKCAEASATTRGISEQRLA